MRTVLVIGIGAGDPDHLTLQAVAAMRRAEVFFGIDKGTVKDDLAALRTELLTRHVDAGTYRVVDAPDPERDRDAGGSAYRDAVLDWQDRRAELYAAMIADELGPDGVGAFLVWGDPSLYDGTLRLLAGIRDADVASGGQGFEIESVPGISSVAALAAAHRLILNRVGGSVLVTTGRRLGAGMPRDVDDVVVMLDGATTFATLPDDDLAIFWGAYLGTPDEILVSGDLQKVKDEIVRVRAEARDRKGWIMDTYLLRRDPGRR
ncbi:MAG: precorrin-6A synthase (deacetylating) [Pseudonocardiaceae bacterium]|nr:MAG: precorrin-6A synthase (deacetylating) [Pseudonocardiaceae bacterium]